MPSPMDFYVYIVASQHKDVYIGVTNSLLRRIHEHKGKTVPGFSKIHDCTRLVYFQHFTDIRYAIAREKQLKGWRRAKKIALIELDNKNWRDLADRSCPPSICKARGNSQGDGPT